MPSSTPQNQGKSISQLMAQALTEISPETSQELMNHPDSPGLVKRIQQIMGGEPTDAMSPAARLEYLKATGADIAAETAPPQQADTVTSEEDAANLARLQAISDMAIEAQRVAANKRDPSAAAPRAQESMAAGLAKLLKKSLETSLADIQKRIK